MNAVSRERPITIAILAIGGQGGGVITDWLIALGERNGWYVQATSVPGVAQRTGATLYYIEMIPESGRTPVLSMMPAPGDVDVVVAAEMMEAGRAIQRGLVTPDRTTLIASSHRAYGILEKTAPGEALGDSDKVAAIARKRAKRFIAFDLQKIADDNKSVISASLFGALAGAEVLPFAREHFEATIRHGGKGVESSLAAFAAACDSVTLAESGLIGLTPAKSIRGAAPIEPTGGSEKELRDYGLAVERTKSFPYEAAPMALAGFRHAVDFQDVAYGYEYLDRLSEILEFDRDRGGLGRNYALTREMAKYLARAMVYDDVIRVADLKTRARRVARVRTEAGAGEDDVVRVTEFMHPRAEEICGTMPARWGRFIEARPQLFRALDRIFNRGRHVRTDSLLWFTVLYALAGLKPRRRTLRRHEVETAHLSAWLDKIRETVPVNYALAVEIVKCRRLIKGYSDTYARGQSKFDKVLAAVPLLVPRADGADWLRRLREAALLDEEGKALDGALKTVATLETDTP
jgi:indolepyruvate ferredoxin oxidoreductase beta subunit